MTQSANSAPKPLLSQTAPSTTSQKSPPFAVPPFPASGPITFVSGLGAGPKQTGKGQGK
jgi:hypothetical protein